MIGAIATFERISIHAPREGSDISFNSDSQKFDISIHAPREGSDRTSKTKMI